DERPRVLLNFAQSLDGKIHPTPTHRQPGFVMSRGKEDFLRMRLVRQRADVVLIGASNLRVDNPGLSLEPGERARRRAQGQPLPARVVVTHRGDGIEPSAKMFDPELGGASYVVHSGQLSDSTRARLSPVATLVELGASTVGVDRLLVWLKRELGANIVLCEGG